jgi:DNA-3-methyladenine glycosylase
MTHKVPMTIFKKKLTLTRLHNTFFRHDVLEVAPALLGKSLVRVFVDGSLHRYTIIETEAYKGIEDKACHASRGMTPRNEVMFRDGGMVYVYLIYGMYWMLNFVTGRKGDASAVLVRGLDGIDGPGRVGRILQLDRSFYGEDLGCSQRIWIEETDDKPVFTSLPRIGIQYAGEPWVSMPWRFKIQQDK